MTDIRLSSRPGLAPGTVLLLSGVLAVVALLIPGTAVVSAAPATEAITVVHDFRDSFQLSSVLWALTGVAAVVAAQLLGTAISGRFVAAGANVLTSALVVWLIATVTSSTNILMTEAQGGTASDLSYLVVGEVAHVLRLTAFLMLAAALVVVALSARGLRVPGLVAAVVVAAPAILRLDFALTIVLPVVLILFGMSVQLLKASATVR